MEPLKIYIVEDEPLIAATIETALEKQGFSVAGDSESYEEALSSIRNTRPDLVLIDIQLEGEKDGIDLASELDLRKVPYLYLTSQTDPETIGRVKETYPLGYIVKPFTEAGLRSNIEVAWNNHLQNREEYLVFNSEGQKYKINQEEILFLKAFDNYCYVVTEKHEYLVPKTLKFTSETLNPNYFVKSHRSYLVNSRKISAMGTSEVRIGNHKVPLSGSHKELLRQKLNS